MGLLPARENHDLKELQLRVSRLGAEKAGLEDRLEERNRTEKALRGHIVQLEAELVNINKYLTELESTPEGKLLDDFAFLVMLTRQLHELSGKTNVRSKKFLEMFDRQPTSLVEQ